MAAGSDGFLSKVLKTVEEGVVTSARSSKDLWPQQRCPKTDSSRKRATTDPLAWPPSQETSWVDHEGQGGQFPGDTQPHQHNFRQRRPCVTNLLDFYHYVFSDLDRSSVVDVVFLNFRKTLIRSFTRGSWGSQKDREEVSLPGHPGK